MSNVCIIDSGYSINNCEDRAGGIEFLAIQTYSSALTFELDETGQIVEAFGGVSPVPVWYVLEQEQEAAAGVQTVEVADNGSVFMTNSITIRFESYTLESRKLMEALLKTKVRIVAKTNNGDYLLFGIDGPGKISEGTLGPNQAFGDNAGGVITMTFRSKKPALFVAPEAIEDLLQFPA